MSVRKHYNPNRNVVRIGQADLDQSLKLFYEQQDYYVRFVKPLLDQGKPLSKGMRKHMIMVLTTAIDHAEKLLSATDQLAFDKELKNTIHRELEWRVKKSKSMRDIYLGVPKPQAKKAIRPTNIYIHIRELHIHITEEKHSKE